MKDYIKQLITNTDNPILARCITREYLQARTLQALQSSLVFTNWAFLGGTALRFLYNLQRFSEDLDFSVTDINKDARFREALSYVKSAFLAENYDLEVRINEGKVVKSAFLQFKGLLYEMDLSPHETETLSIKVEIDTNPPEGAKTETTIVRKYGLINIHHYDQASLLAGKLHAVLMRKYTKGRDIYDLMWYLSDRNWPKPNLLLLNNALKQSSWHEPALSENSWRTQLAETIEGLDFSKVLTDVAPFIENAEERKLLTKDYLLKMLR